MKIYKLHNLWNALNYYKMKWNVDAFSEYILNCLHLFDWKKLSSGIKSVQSPTNAGETKFWDIALPEWLLLLIFCDAKNFLDYMSLNFSLWSWHKFVSGKMFPSSSLKSQVTIYSHSERLLRCYFSVLSLHPLIWTLPRLLLERNWLLIYPSFSNAFM